MNRSDIKMTLRSVKTFKGRFFALMLIVAIGVGFFSGMRISESAMIDTADEYLEKHNFYDFKLMSTLGFTEKDIETISQHDGIADIEGRVSVDAMASFNGNVTPFKFISMPQRINLPSLTAGRMPVTRRECLADGNYFTSQDIGKVIYISTENDSSVRKQFTYKAYTIVGLANSPEYLNLNRGNTNIGTGALSGFIFLKENTLRTDYYTELNIKLKETAPAYSKEYEKITEKHKAELISLCREIANRRYHELLKELDIPNQLAVIGLPAKQLAAMFGLSQPDVYVLSRSENLGYVSYENDTAIVSGIANIFPVFFILIAMFVCITTMTRMVDEERTQIGVLKALGYTDSRIMSKYLLYSGSATIIGWLIGFFACTWGLPKIFWMVYGAIYNFAPINYVFDPVLAIVTLAISLSCILTATFISCRKELSSAPSQLIRPRATKNGKRILLERIHPLWNRFSFLGKVITRNMFRYKRKLVMMLLGISCCAGLMLAAFGARNSMVAISSEQYDNIQKYDIEVTFSGTDKNLRARLDRHQNITDYKMASVNRVDLVSGKISSAVNMMSFSDTERLSEFWNFKDGNDPIEFPATGSTLICQKLSDKLGIDVGDTITIRDTNLNTYSLTVSGVFDNYIYNYIVISADTYREIYGSWQANTALLKINGDANAVAETLTKIGGITGITQLGANRESVNEALSCLDYVIWLIVAFSAALAFVVIFDLTNINLAERSREIATVQVLGFYPKETNSYILRENLIMSIIAAIIGIPLGLVFHRLVMRSILIDALYFPTVISPWSFVIAFCGTVLFAIIVNLLMHRRIRKIKMAESLKAVE